MKRSLELVRPRKSFPFISTLLATFLFCQPSVLLIANAQGRSRGEREMTEDQRVAQVLSRLTFGARPGDFEKVKSMGVDAFISQQLDPDSVENGAVIAKLGRLRTLGMATPAEKVAVGSIAQIGSDKPNADKMSGLPAAAMPGEMQMEAKKDGAGKTA